MNDVIDVIHNLSFQVSGDGLDVVLTKMKAQADAIDKMKSKLEELQEYYNTAQNVQQQEQARAAIDKTTSAIDIQTQALQKQFNSNRTVQNALNTELGLIQKLTDKLNDLRHARDRQTDMAGIRSVNTDIATTKKELASLMQEGTKGGGILAGLFGGNGGSLGRQLLTGGLIGLGIGGGMGLVTRATSALVDYASILIDTEEKERKLAQTTQQTTDAIIKQVDTLEEYYQRIRDIVGVGNQQAQIDLDAAKARGAINGETGNAELEQFNLEQKQRAVKLRDLKEQEQVLIDIGAANTAAGQSGDYEKVINNPGAYGVSTTTADILRTKLAQAEKDKVSNKDLYTQLTKETIDKREENQLAQQKLAGDQTNAQTAYEAKLRTETYNKTKELNQQLLQEAENYRQLKEKGDIQSVDKIISDTQAKYKLLYSVIYKSAIDEAKKYPGFDEKNPLGNLPKPIRDRYSSLFADNKRDQGQDTANQQYEYQGSQYSNYLNNSASLSRGGADIEKAKNAFGMPSYDDLSKALDEDTQAKKDALHTQFVAQASTITDSTLVIEAQKQYDEKLLQIDNDAYKERLNLADDYYSRLSQKILAASSILSLQISTQTASQKTAILSGGGSKEQKNRRTRRSDLQGDQATQQNIIDTQDKLLPSLDANRDNSTLELDQAKGTPDESTAQDQYDKDAKAYEAAQNTKALAAEKYQEDANALHDQQTQQIVEAIDLTQSLADTTVKAYDTIANARQQDLDREIAVRTQRVDMAEKLAERGNTTALAQEQKALDTANQQKRSAALQEQEINAALTVSNALLAVAKAAVEGGGFASIATIAAVIAALGVGFAEAEALNNTNKQSFAKGIVNFRGKGGPTDDANQVNISTGESVITAAATAKYGGMLEAMNKGMPVFAAPPTLAPMKTMLPNEHYATKSDFKELKTAIDTQTEILAGKQVHVAQTVNKSGIHQIVTEEQRASANQWRA